MTTRADGLPVDSFSPRQIRGLVSAIASFPSHVRARGRDYAARSRVGPLLFQTDAVAALVRGTRVYIVWWTWERESWSFSCNCPVGFECKHQYAVACCALQPLLDRGPSSDRRLVRLLPDRLARPAELGHPSPRTRPREDAALQSHEDGSLEEERTTEEQGLERDETDEAGADEAAVDARVPPGSRGLRSGSWWSNRSGKPSPPFHTRRPVSLAALRAAPDLWTRRAVLDQMLGEYSYPPIPYYESPYREILSGTDFDLMCWLLADVLPARFDGWLPPALEPYRERRDLQERHLHSLRKSFATRLAGWSAERPVVPERSLRFVIGFGPMVGGKPALTFDGRLSSQRFRDEPRTAAQLQQLLRAAERRPGTLPAGQAEILLAYLSGHEDWRLGWHSTSRPMTTTRLLRLLEAGAGTSGLVWDPLLDAELAARFGLSPGEPVRFERQPTEIVPVCVPRDGTLVLDLEVRWPDGRSRSLGDALLLRGTVEGACRNPSLLLCDGAFHRVAEQPPGDITDHFVGLDGLPLERTEHLPLLDQMAQRFPSMRRSLAPFTRVRAVTPMVAIDLREDDWLQIRLFAVPADSVWRPLAPVSDAAKVLEYEPQAVWRALSTGIRRRGSPDFERTSTDTRAAPSVEAEGSPAASDEAAASPPVGDDAAAPPTEPVWLERMDDSALAPALEWLGVTGAHDGRKDAPRGRSVTAPDSHIGWWVRLGPRRSAVFAAAWDQRPGGVHWYCTPSAKRLLSDARPVQPRLRVAGTGLDWFGVSAEWEAEGLKFTDEDLAALRRASGPYVKISSGWVRREAGDRVEHAAETLAELGIEPGGGEQRLSIWQLAQASPESLHALEAFGADPGTLEAIQTLRHKVAQFTGLPHAPVPTGFRGTLRPYQQLGVDFLAYASTLGLGTVLADDMGLGKTVQALAWLLWLRQRTPGLGPALVVCPASVVHNWAREAESFAPGLRVALLTSGGQRRGLLRETASHDLLVTNYSLLRRDLEAWKRIPLGVAILDEAQNIKNPDAAVSRATLDLEARHRLALTGTPIENRALDLWSIMAFVNPGLFGPRAAFAARFDRAKAPTHTRRLLAARLRPVLLRRMKQEVAPELPPRIEERRDCELHPGQRRLYVAEVARTRKLLEEIAAAPEGLARYRIQILTALTRLRQICCHPALAGGEPGAGSGKFDALWELLEPLLAEGHKVLVFSQFVRCLNLLKAELVTRDIAHHMLTGQTRKREEVVAGFQADERPAVFLISLKAGGTGLNLTAASYVVLFDPWWNPAVEAQAIDRTHRIGQTRTVIAYRLLTRGTLEEKIWELQRRKAALARDVLGEDGFARGLTREDLEYLLAPE
jgi:superfamily II DNA or RNA helicase